MNISTVTQSAPASAAVTASQTPSMPRTMGRRMRASSWNSKVRRKEMSVVVNPF